VQELTVTDQKQSRVSFGLSISAMNAVAMRPTAAILKERGTICRPAVGPPRQVCNFERGDILSKGGVHVTTMLAAAARSCAWLLVAALAITRNVLDLD
jgi:hypothetical protein